MDEKYIAPLLGVFLGWLLTSISSSFKEMSSRKQKIGNLLTKLIRVERQLNLVILATENMKDAADSWESYEPIRKGVVDRHFMVPETVSSDLKAAIDNVAPFFPIMAIDLENLYQLILKNKEASLLANSKNEAAYIRMLSIYEVGLDFCKSELAKITVNLALKHGFLTYIKLKIVNSQREKNRAQSFSQIEKIMADIRAEIKKSKETPTSEHICN